MDTKKDSIQDERIPDVFAPRAEPGAANKTIPRRDLLTGAALVLVGSASGCHPQPPAAAATNETSAASANAASAASANAAGAATAAGASACGGTQLFRTQFMQDFTAQFIGDPSKIKAPGQTDTWPDPDPPSTAKTRLWPLAPQGPGEVAADYATFVNVLLKRAYVGGPDPTYPSGSLDARILQFLQNHNWPSATPQPPTSGAPIPPDYLTKFRPMITLVEISVILDRLLQAISTYSPNPQGGAGGGGTPWPPH